MNKQATGDDDVPGDVLKLLGEGGLKIMMKLIKAIYETGVWPKDFKEVITTGATSYKVQRPSHNKPYRKYNKDSSKDT